MSAIPGGIWKVTIHELNRNIQQIGREVNTEEIADIVMNHAAATAVSAAASGVCPARATPVGAADGLPEQLSACLAVSDRADTIRMDAWRKSLPSVRGAMMPRWWTPGLPAISRRNG